MRWLLACLIALTASHALTWGGAAHIGHGQPDSSPELSAATFDHGHADCAQVRVDAAVPTGAFQLQRPPFQLEHWFPSAIHHGLRSSERWPDAHAPPA